MERTIGPLKYISICKFKIFEEKYILSYTFILESDIDFVKGAKTEVN
jgi:hypothetical protein